MERDKEIKNINIEDIIPNRFQPRLSFEPEALNELAESIKQYGIFQPLVVRGLANKYEIIAGERRYKAAVLAGFKDVPCVVVEIDDNESAEIALVENLQRRDLTPIEEAKSFQKLLDRGYITQEQLAKRMGKSQSAIANKVRLLNLPDEVQDALLESRISERHARSLLSLKSSEEQIKLLNEIMANRLTVKDTDEKIKSLLNIQPEETFIDMPLNNQNVDKEIEVSNVETPIFTPVNFEDDINNIFPQFMGTRNDEPKLDIMDLLKLDEISFQEPTIEETQTDLTPTEEPIIEGTLDEVQNESTPIDSIKEVPGEQIENMMLLDELTETSNNIVEVNDFPIIEDIKPYMSVTNDLPIINYESSEVPTTTSEVKEIPKNNIYVTNNLRTAINTIRDCVVTLEKFGFAVEKDELDLDNMYSITIKIKKSDA